MRLHGVGNGSPAERAGLGTGDLLLRANGGLLFGVDDLKRALVLNEGTAVQLEVESKRGRRSLSIEPEPPRRRAA